MSTYSIGSLVKFRGREWVVMPSQEEDVLSLRPLTGGEEAECGAYLPLERGYLEPTVFPLPGINDIGDFESARLLRDAARLLLRHGAGPFRSMGHLSVRPRPYQLVPLLMALRLDPVRMLIADDVGIGKTIEAALIARELLDRGEVQRLAIICPPYLCDQWQRELSEKFNIDAVIIRTSTLSRLERGLPSPNLSVFEYYRHMVVSVDFVKSQRRRDAFLLHCPELVILDEAHGCARPPGQSAGQQQRHELIADLAKNESRHLILVTATPHSGVEESFLSLLGFIRAAFEKLDIETIGEYQRAELARHFIQRRRADVKQWMGTETFFPERDSIEVSYALSPEYEKLFKDVYKFARELVLTGESAVGFRRRVRYWAALSLLRCVMSSPAAAKAALLSRIKSISEIEASGELDYSSYIFDPTDVESSVDVAPTHVVEESEKTLSTGEKRKLREFSRRTEELKGDGDRKIKKAEEEVRNLLRGGFRPIVYCRFIATSDYVAEELHRRLGPDFGDLHVISITGLQSEEEREIRVAELCKSPRRVLVATDCLSEGINLQDGFNAVLHYDLPWNPNRLEQREGRVDRFGQRSRIIRAVLLYGADNPIDGAVLNVLLRKAKLIHKRLGITIPIPVNSESVMETVLKALFLRGDDSLQLGLFDDLPVVEVHRQWDRAAERERMSRTRFAQHAIRPDEIAGELETNDRVLGNPQVVEKFVRTACQRLGAPLVPAGGHWRVDVNHLPEAVRAKLPGGHLTRIAFDQPVSEGVTYISRNHPLASALAETIFDIAMQQDGDRNIAARCGVIRSRDVEILTTLLLLRLRYAVRRGGNGSLSVAEECVITGFEGTVGTGRWLSEEEAKLLFERATPSGNVLDNERKHRVATMLEDFEAVKDKIDEAAKKRANDLLHSYGRLRKTIRGERISVESLLPGDVLSISIIVPQPKV
ncbi:MAG: DEAD/DEAH box helicase [Deltaproteobacteria bacterium]|nr:DEAD/DEAH box helicase [Deltaproteobacteria bacterium]